MMKRTTLLVAAACLMLCASCSQYKYETVAGDPLGTKIYTLDNGLKVYMSVNKEAPRIQTYIAVKVGGKNDPSETTGLAHYFEHLMFKGTQKFGTSDYAAEKPLLDQIEALFEVYRLTEDEAERARIYHQIDSISYIASDFFIPNEYDKLMSLIGAKGTNAYTSTDDLEGDPLAAGHRHRRFGIGKALVLINDNCFHCVSPFNAAEFQKRNFVI